VPDRSSEVSRIETEVIFEVHEGGIWLTITDPLPPGFSQVLILKQDETLCFDTLLQVLILNGLQGWFFCLQEGNGGEWTGFGGIRRTTWRKAIVS
jgi:hypothetical protein